MVMKSQRIINSSVVLLSSTVLFSTHYLIALVNPSEAWAVFPVGFLTIGADARQNIDLTIQGISVCLSFYLSVLHLITIHPISFTLGGVYC